MSNEEHPMGDIRRFASERAMTKKFIDDQRSPMSTYQYQDFLENTGEKEEYLFSFGLNDMCKWYFIPEQYQLVIKNTSLTDTFNISYSGSVYTQYLNQDIQSSAPGVSGIIQPGQQAYFSDYLSNGGQIAKYDYRTNPVSPNMYLMCKRITIGCANDIKEVYVFNCNNENYHIHNAILITGDRLSA